MQSTIKLSIGSLVAALLFTFAITLPAYAESEIQVIEYSELEIEIDQYTDGVTIEISYENDDKEEIEKEYTFNETDLDKVYERLADKLGLTVAEIEAASSVSDEDGSVSDEEATATTTEKVDDDKGHGNDKDECDEDNPGKKDTCTDEDKKVDEEKPAPKDILKERFQNFGKTTDRTELQTQLQELLVMLIELLQKKMLFQ